MITELEQKVLNWAHEKGLNNPDKWGVYQGDSVMSKQDGQFYHEPRASQCDIEWFNEFLAKKCPRCEHGHLDYVKDLTNAKTGNKAALFKCDSCNREFIAE